VLKNRPSLLTLLLFGVIGPGAVWAAPDPSPPGQMTPTAAPAKELTELRARLVELRSRQQTAPNDPDLSYQLGALYLDLGDPKTAEEQLRRAIDGGTTVADAWVLLGQAWLLQGKLVEVQAQIPANQLSGTLEKAGVAVLQGLAWLAKDRPQDARERFQAALNLEPDFAPAYVGLARASLAEGHLPAARDALTSAAQGRLADPAEVATLRGDLAAAGKDYVAAEAAYQQAFDLKPYQVWRLRPLAQVQIAQKKLDAADANLARVRAALKTDQITLYLQGLSALLRGDFQRAADTVAPLLEGQVELPGALQVAGTAAYQLGQYQQARELLGLFLQRQPNDPDAQRTVGATLVRLGEPKEALPFVLPLVQGGNPEGDDLRLAGVASILAGETKTGVAYLDKVQALRPDDKELRRFIAAVKAGSEPGLGGNEQLEKLVAEGGEGLEDLELGLLQRRLRTGDYGQVQTAAARFRQRYPQRPEGWLYEGIALLRTGNPAAARPAFERVLSLSPGNLDALIGLAEVQLAAGDPQGAGDSIVAALQASPGNPLLLDNLIIVAVAAGKPERAIETIQPLLAADPENKTLAALLARAQTAAGQPLAALEFLGAREDAQDPALLRERGLAELRAGRLEASVVTFRQLAEAAPQSAQAQVDLARATELAGDAAAARRLWDKAASLEPANGAARVGQVNAALLALSAPVTPDKLKQILDQVTEVLKQYPTAPGAAELEATALIATKQPQLAAQRLTVLYARTREPIDAMFLSRAQLYAKDKAAALAVLRDHVSRYPGDTQVRMDLADRYLDEGQVNPAVEQLSAILAQDWGRTDVHLELAYVLLKSGRKEDAAPHLRVVEKALPNDKRVKELQGLMKH
jgi:putative PEP-CTERM system TPR-repeat lipoprotein